MKKICQNCLNAKPIHPVSKQRGYIRMRCTKFGFAVFEDTLADCWEKFVGWAYR